MNNDQNFSNQLNFIGQNSSFKLENDQFLDQAIDCLNQGQYEEALNLLEKLISLEPNNITAWEKKAIALQNLGKINEAINTNKTILNLYSASNEIKNKNNEGKATNNREEYSSEKLEFLLRKLVEEYKNKNWQVALQDAKTILKINTQYYQVWNIIGSVYSNLNKDNEALICFNKALEINPKFELALHNKGNLFYKQNKLDDALMCFNQVLEINSNFFLSLDNKGAILLERNNFQEATECFDKSLEINPDVYLSWENKGKVSARLGDLEKALIFYDKALSIEPNLGKLWNDKGNILSSLGKAKEALICYNQALELSLNNLWMAALNKGIIVRDLKGDEEAIKVWNQGIKNLIPDVPDYDKAYGTFCWQKAKTYFNKINKSDLFNLSAQDKQYLYQSLSNYFQTLNYFHNSSLEFNLLKVLKEIIVVCNHLDCFEKRELLLAEGKILFVKILNTINDTDYQKDFIKEFAFFNKEQ